MKKIAILILALLVLCCVFVACEKEPAPNSNENTKKVTAIEAVNIPDTYFAGATIDYDSLQIKVTYSDNTTETKTLKELGALVTNKVDTSKAGTGTYKISYEGKTIEITVTVKDVKVTEISIVESLPDCYVGDTLDYSAVKLLVKYDDGTSETKTVGQLGATVTTPADVSAVGQAAFTVELQGKQAQGAVTVKAVVATKLEIVSTLEDVYVGTTVDYNAVQVKVTYNNGKVETKTVSELGAEFTPANVSIANEKAEFTISYQGLSVKGSFAVVGLDIVAFESPSFWANYKTTVGSTSSGELNFADKTQKYEVGNVNKFLFNPSLEYVEWVDDEPVFKTITQGVKTTVKVEMKNDGGAYQELTTAEISTYVEIANNAYQFTEAAADREFKLTISPDATVYTAEDIDSIIVECIVIDGGYNVYEQHGLSVLNDCDADVTTANWYEKSLWNEIWRAGTATPLQLEADDKPLYQYVGNIDWVIIHESFNLDPYKMPSAYFWLEENIAKGYYSQDDYNSAKATASQALKSENGNLGAKYFEGSLRDGLGNNSNNFVNINEDTATRTVPHHGVQKGLYQSHKVNISGNYNQISVTNKHEKEGDRNLWVVLDYYGSDSNGGKPPIPHWAIFKFVKAYADSPFSSVNEAYDSNKQDKKVTVGLKNIFMSGNSKRNEDSVQPCGMMMVTSLMDEINFTNVVGTQFYTTVVQSHWSAASKEYIANPVFNLTKVNFTNAYSNMVYCHKGTFNVTDSVLSNCGGPLFLMIDQDRNYGSNELNAPHLNVTNSTLEAWADGTEAWYAQYDATVLINQLKQFDDIFKGIDAQLTAQGSPITINKTILQKNNDSQCVNVIAAIIPNTGSVVNGNGTQDIQIKGSASFTSKGVTSIYDMENTAVATLLGTVRQLLGAGQTAQGTALKGAPILQSGNNYMAYNGKTPCDATVESISAGASATLSQSTIQGWATSSTDTLGIYMSAASITNNQYSPTFGAIVGFYPRNAN